MNNNLLQNPVHKFRVWRINRAIKSDINKKNQAHREWLETGEQDYDGSYPWPEYEDIQPDNYYASLDMEPLFAAARRYYIKIEKDWIIDEGWYENNHYKLLSVDGEYKLRQAIQRAEREKWEWLLTKIVTPVSSILIGAGGIAVAIIAILAK